MSLCKAFIEPWSFQKIFGLEKLKTLWNNWLFRQLIHSVQLTWQAAPIKISAVFLVFSMVSAFWGKVFGVCCFILLVAAVQPKKILWDLWNLVRSARFCQRSASLQRSCFARFRSYIFITCKYFLQNLRICLQTLYRVTLAFPSVFNGF